MDIRYQYYNEIVLAFRNYDTDFSEGIIVIYVPDDNKPFESVFNKIELQIGRISEQLDVRDKEVVIRVQKGNRSKELQLPAQ